VQLRRAAHRVAQVGRYLSRGAGELPFGVGDFRLAVFDETHPAQNCRDQGREQDEQQ
jgi:hypothetical protein